MRFPPTPRRRFLAEAGRVAATGALLQTAALDPLSAVAGDLGRARTISIFHTTDLHGRILPTSTYEGLDDVGGFARCATCLRQWRAQSPHSLTVDVGDVVQGTAVSLDRGGNLMMELFNQLEYDAWTLGNHDFDWGPEKLLANIALAKAPALSANLAIPAADGGAGTGAWRGIKPWMIRDVGGFRIALVGLITPGLSSWLAAETLGGLEATDPVEALRTSVAEARGAGADAVVVLGHMGWRFKDDYANPVRQILRDVKDIDVYLAGHSHQNQPSWMLHNVVCSQASYYGIHCGRVDLTFDLESRKLIDRRAFTLLMDDRFPLDPLVMQLAQPDLAGAEAQLARTVATATQKIAGGGRGSRLGELLCAAFASALSQQGTPVEGVFHGTFSSGDLAAGPVTVADCWRIIPYENLLVTGELSAGELLEVLREDAADKKSDRMLWPFETIRGDNGQPAALHLAGEPVDPGRRFMIACNSYDSQSGGRRLHRLCELLARPEAKRTLTAIDTRTALIGFCLRSGTLA